MATVLDDNKLMNDLIWDMANTREGNSYAFYKSATEALVTKADINAKAALLTRLYKDISDRSMVDYGQIPASKGDFTKFVHYETVVKTMESLNAIYKDTGKDFEEVQLMNDLYNVILVLKEDFKYGYLHEIEFIKLQYNTLVLTFLEMENLCIMAYMKYVKDVKAANVSFDEYRKKDLQVIKSAKSFLASYHKGEWRQIMKSFKSGRGAMATEAFNVKGAINAFGNALLSDPATGKDPTGETSKLSNSDGALRTFLKALHLGQKDADGNFKWTTGGKIVGGIGLLFAALWALRLATFYFYNKAARLSDTLKLQLSFLEVVNEDPQALNPKTARLSKGLVKLANSTVGLIDGKLFGADAKAKKQLRDANKVLADDVENELNTPSQPVIPSSTEPATTGAVNNDDDFLLM